MSIIYKTGGDVIFNTNNPTKTIFLYDSSLPKSLESLSIVKYSNIHILYKNNYHNFVFIFYDAEKIPQYKECIKFIESIRKYNILHFVSKNIFVNGVDTLKEMKTLLMGFVANKFSHIHDVNKIKEILEKNQFPKYEYIRDNGSYFGIFASFINFIFQSNDSIYKLLSLFVIINEIILHSIGTSLQFKISNRDIFKSILLEYFLLKLDNIHNNKYYEYLLLFDSSGVNEFVSENRLDDIAKYKYTIIKEIELLEYQRNDQIFDLYFSDKQNELKEIDYRDVILMNAYKFYEDIHVKNMNEYIIYNEKLKNITPFEFSFLGNLKVECELFRQKIQYLMYSDENFDKIVDEMINKKGKILIKVNNIGLIRGIFDYAVRLGKDNVYYINENIEKRKTILDLYNKYADSVMILYDVRYLINILKIDIIYVFYEKYLLDELCDIYEKLIDDRNIVLNVLHKVNEKPDILRII